MQKIAIFWFRRDLRLHDNAGLYHALKSGFPVLPVFIFDTGILDKLEDKQDRRVEFIHLAISGMQKKLAENGSAILVKTGNPLTVFQEISKEYEISSVYANHDYEPSAKARDLEVQEFLQSKSIGFFTFKDQVIFEKEEILNNNGSPYTVFTPYSKKWKSMLNDFYLKPYPVEKYYHNFIKKSALLVPSLEQIGFIKQNLPFPSSEFRAGIVSNYGKNRDFPGIQGTSRLSVHLRFGTISVRELAAKAKNLSEVYLNELIWRDFYMMILNHFPHVVKESFKREYDRLEWRNNEAEFDKWCEGKTGYPLVDAGMRELNETGFMHNRVRMVTASFLVKHLLIDWRWGEAYFAKKLLDFDLSANNGGWQWAAGCGTDAAPYFRIFNPTTQMEKFDPERSYIKQWLPDIITGEYPSPIVNHVFARERVLNAYKKALGK